MSNTNITNYQAAWTEVLLKGMQRSGLFIGRIVAIFKCLLVVVLQDFDLVLEVCFVFFSKLPCHSRCNPHTILKILRKHYNLNILYFHSMFVVDAKWIDMNVSESVLSNIGSTISRICRILLEFKFSWISWNLKSTKISPPRTILLSKYRNNENRSIQLICFVHYMLM